MKGKNIFFCAVLSDPWLEVGKRLEAEGHSIRYWLGWDMLDTKKEISETFRNAIFHDNESAWRGFLPGRNAIELNQRLSIPIEFWENYRNELRIALKIFDRLDADGYSFNLMEREDFLFDQVALWYNQLVDNDIDCVIFSVSPHRGFDYIIYLISKFLNINTLLFKHSYIAGLSYPVEDIDGDIVKIDVKDITNIDRFRLLENKCKAYQEAKRAEDVVPYYMLEQNRSNNSKIVYKRFFWHLLPSRIFKLSKSFLKYRDHNHNLFSVRNYAISADSFKLFDVQKKLKKEYKKNTKPFAFNPEEQYLLFALHYQPEETTVPSAGMFYNQFNLIKHISSQLSDDQILLVKEHTTQFHPMYEGYRGRYRFIYDNIATLKNVILVDENYSSNTLLNQVSAVITLTGTIGLEALLLGKPAIVFGNAWYRKIKGVVDVFGNHSLYNELGNIFRELPKVENQAIFEGLKELSNYLLPAYLYKGYEKHALLSKADNETIVYEYVKRWLDKN